MNVPTPAVSIKLQLTLAAVMCGLSGCATVIPEAQFVARAGSVVRGDLSGPFDGRVLDRQTGRAVPGAAVLASWGIETGVGVVAPSASRTFLTSTDHDGRYVVPAIRDDLRGKRVRFTLIVYQRGYVAYRSDSYFEDFASRYDFAQSGNLVELGRFPAEGSYVRHLGFIGAGQPLLPALAWELQRAADEIRLQGKPAEETAEPAGAPPDASLLLSSDELKAVTGYAGDFALEKLRDRPTAHDYDSVHFRAVGKPEAFDAAIRLFRLAPTRVEERYDALAKEYPSVEEKNEVGDRSLRAKERDIFAVVALDRGRSAVVVFTCGEAQCHDADTLVRLVERMWPRLDKALALTAASPSPPLSPTKTDDDSMRLRPPEMQP